MVAHGPFDTLFALDKHRMIFKQVNLLPDGKRFWGHSEDSYYLFHPEARSQVTYPFNAIPGVHVAHPSLPIDGQRRLWYPGPDGNFRFMTLPAPIPIGLWHRFRLDNKGNFWIWAHDKRMYRYVVATETLEFIGVLDFWDYDLNSPFEDREGNIWIPHFYGVTKLVPHRRLFENYLNLPLNELGIVPGGKSVYGMREAPDGSIFIHLGERKVARLLPNSTNPELVEGFSFGIPDDDRLVLRQAIVQSRLNIDLERLTYLRDSGNDALWLCPQPSTGIYRVDLKKSEQRFFEISKLPVSIWGMLLLDGHLWINADNGLYRLDPASGRFQHFTTKEGLPHNVVYSMLPDGNDLWLDALDEVVFRRTRGESEHQSQRDRTRHERERITVFMAHSR